MAGRKHPPATREHHDSFCTTEQWELKRGATGQPVRHHRTYILRLWDGRVLRTRLSRPVDGSEYPASMWAHILRAQLEVDTASFWACVEDQVLPDRGAPKPRTARKPIPLHLYRELTRLGVPESEIAELDAAGAANRYAAILAAGDGVE